VADVVIFGAGDHAEQAHYYLGKDSPHRVAAFALSAPWIKEDTFCGLPVVDFESVEQGYPPSRFCFFVAMSARRMNRDRARFYNEAKSKGYDLISYISSRALLCDNPVGENCFILEDTNIQPFTTIGNNTIIWCASHVGHHSRIADHVFVSSLVGISGRCTISSHCHISGSAIIDAGVTLAEGTLAGLGSVVTRDTDAWSIYTGNPARKRKVSSRDHKFL
jgi:sugar O-acyltransferase (sialic acid O-acetyltransferase NeuD family)